MEDALDTVLDRVARAGYRSTLEESVALLKTPTADHSVRGRLRPERLDGARYSLQDQIGALLPTPNARDYKDAAFPPSLDTHRAGDTDKLVRVIHVNDGGYGPYQEAVDRWEQVLGRPAPPPVVLGRNGRPRLSPLLVEWMMGLPEGWVTDTGIAHSQQLRCLGNGVVPAQCALALRILLDRMSDAVEG